jgi:hypothetical protein
MKLGINKQHIRNCQCEEWVSFLFTNYLYIWLEIRKLNSQICNRVWSVYPAFFCCSGIQFDTGVRSHRISAVELHVLIQLFPRAPPPPKRRSFSALICAFESGVPHPEKLENENRIEVKESKFDPLRN